MQSNKYRHSNTSGDQSKGLQKKLVQEIRPHDLQRLSYASPVKKLNFDEDDRNSLSGSHDLFFCPPQTSCKSPKSTTQNLGRTSTEFKNPMYLKRNEFTQSINVSPKMRQSIQLTEQPGGRISYVSANHQQSHSLTRYNHSSFQDTCVSPTKIKQLNKNGSSGKFTADSSVGGYGSNNIILMTEKTNKTMATTKSEEDCTPIKELQHRHNLEKHSSDMKAIKISQLIDYHREIEKNNQTPGEIQFDLFGAQSQSSDLFCSEKLAGTHEKSYFEPLILEGSAAVPPQIHLNDIIIRESTKSASKAELLVHRRTPYMVESIQEEAHPKITPDFTARQFELPQTLQGDRFIPIRQNNDEDDDQEAERFQRKIEIECRPPEHLNEDSGVEAQPQQQNNQQNSNQNTPQTSSELNTGENLRKYNIMLQKTMLGINDPHLVTNSFLNENSTVLNSQQPNGAMIQGLPQGSGSMGFQPNSVVPGNHHYLNLMATDPYYYQCAEDWNLMMGPENSDDQDVSSMAHSNTDPGPAKQLKVLNYRREGTENQYPLSNTPVVRRPQSLLSELNQPVLSNPFSGYDNDSLLSVPYKHQRKIAKCPFKVLDAPALQDDYYLNLVDWSSQNVLAVGLGSCVYLWSATSSKVTKLYDLSQENGYQGGDQITSVSWSGNGESLAVGTTGGILQNWDINKQKMVRKFGGHDGRIGCVAWTSSFMSSGSRDKTILHRDMRQKADFFARLEGHKQEVCGLKWSPDEQQLASGGNDNKLMIWGRGNSYKPIVKFSEHVAAVKAIAWSPHQHGTMCSGGGTADRCIRFWNTLTCKPMHWVDTGSQVCNLVYSKNVNELVSTHGYSKNEIIVWKQPQMKKLAVLTGHTYRVLYLAMSPDGQTLVTGAGDETLRFWKVFPPKKQARQQISQILPSINDLR